MINACICTIGDEILIGQVLDTNSSHLAVALEEAGVRVTRMVSIGDNKKDIRETLKKELSRNSVVITTGGLGPTKDDITKDILARLSGSRGYVEHAGQMEIIRKRLASRNLSMLPSNQAQALVPDSAEVIVNKNGTAPIMVFRNICGGGTLYALPGVPHEAVAAIPDIVEDIRAHQQLTHIYHRNIMVYGIAESALSERIAPWEDALPADMHLAYLPNQLTGIRLRLSIYSGDPDDEKARAEQQITRLKEMLGDLVYADGDSTLEETLGAILKAHNLTVSCAESCTGGEIAHLFTSVSGSSAYFLGSVTSYAVSVKEKVLGVPAETISKYGVVSSEVAAAMAEGVRRVTGSDYSVSTTGLAGPSGDEHNPVGTVWIGVAGPQGTKTVTYRYNNDRKRNIERFAASALDFLRKSILADLNR
ncbi:MAG: CinA family nicotinamide mononucleotide deamidase-related protein [Bacteroidales bacterium]|nr:CinA family nicotinamide mononucleotide deamidase-related protein [Bacteroidales bacterium]